MNASAHKAAKVLVVDDDQDIRQAIKEALELSVMRFEIHLAHNAVAGLQVANELLPDIIILDLQMPYGDGFAMAEDIHKNPNLRHTKILMMTAQGNRENLWTSVDKKIDDFLPKPFDLSELEARIHGLLRDRDELTTKDY
jgi:DNA-binding response OmpR family regulator